MLTRTLTSAGRWIAVCIILWLALHSGWLLLLLVFLPLLPHLAPKFSEPEGGRKHAAR
jgi:hypothetical protein